MEGIEGFSQNHSTFKQLRAWANTCVGRRGRGGVCVCRSFVGWWIKWRSEMNVEQHGKARHKMAKVSGRRR